MPIAMLDNAVTITDSRWAIVYAAPDACVRPSIGWPPPTTECAAYPLPEILTTVTWRDVPDGMYAAGPLDGTITITLARGWDYIVFAIPIGLDYAQSDVALAPLRCRADMDHSGGVTIDDLLIYLRLYDAGSTCADTDDGTGSGVTDGGVGIEDLLHYLAAFDAGC